MTSEKGSKSEKKPAGRKSNIVALKPEFRILIKKNASLKQSSFLQTMRNKHIGAELATNPYAKELEQVGLKFIPVKVKMIKPKKASPVARASMAHSSNLDDHHEIDAST